MNIAKFYGRPSAWAGGSLHDARRAREVLGPVQRVRPRDEPTRADHHEDRCAPHEGRAALSVQGDLRVARHDDGGPAELVHAGMGTRTARGNRGHGAVRQVRRLAGLVHSVAALAFKVGPAAESPTRFSARFSGTIQIRPERRNLILATRIRGPEGVGSWSSGTSGRGRTRSRRPGRKNSTRRTRPPSTRSVRISDRSIRCSSEARTFGPPRHSRTRALPTRTSSSACSRKEAARIRNMRLKPRKRLFPTGPRPRTRTESDSFNAPPT